MVAINSDEADLKRSISLISRQSTLGGAEPRVSLVDSAP